MKRIYSLTIALLCMIAAWAQGGSGEGYDPSNPPEPMASYRLTINSSPSNGGWTSPSGTWREEVGAELYLSAYPSEGYEFRAWMKGDEVISTESSFRYTMQKENAVITAWFDYVGIDYNPSNPGDPFFDGYRHWVRAYANPSAGGWISGNNFQLIEGQKTTIYANPNSGYRFASWKQDGKIISTDPALEVSMKDIDLEYVATFVYNPESPGDPNVNSWNSATGELIIDHFTPGYLYSAINQLLGWSDYDKVVTITVIGKMNPNDFNAIGNLTNLDVADFSRTSGASYVPNWAFEGLQSLTKILLPASVAEIYDYALYSLPNLSELVVYAAMPPMVDSYGFYNIPENLVVKVYSGSVDLYENAEVWRNYKIMTIDDDSASLTVTLPDDNKEGKYKNASLQLSNLSTGQTSKLILNEKRNQYIFRNLIPEMKYSLYVLAPNGSVMGRYLEFEMPKEGMEYTFKELKHLQDVTIQILTPEQEDIASEVTVSWFDNNEKVIGSGAVLSGQLAGESVIYDITLPQEYGVIYVAPEKGNWTVVDADNTVTVQLQPFAPFILQGYIKDSKLGHIIPDAYITITQMLNGNYTVSSTVSSGSDGMFTLQIYDAPGSITAGAADYFEATVNFRNLAEIKLVANLLLEAIGGSELNITMLRRENITKNSLDNAFSTFTDYANVEFEVTNLSTGEPVTFIMKYPRMVLPGNVKDGDKLLVKATPGKSNFNPVKEEVVISDGKADLKLAFTTNGDIHASYKSAKSDHVIGMLYNSEGKLQSTANYDSNSALFKYLPQGSYTLVTAEDSKMFSTIASLDDLSSLAFEAGKDYLISEVNVEDGYITEIEFNEVPELDETQAYATTSETSVSVNKMNVTVGTTVTVRSKVEFLPEYSDVEKVKITFTIPDGCEYVEGSLLVAGGGSNFTTIENGKISVELPVKDASPRFCIIPRVSGDYRPSAVIEFKHNGMLVRQPIGSALFTAGDFSISVPERTGSTTITARGTTTALSEVRVYDNDVFVGSTHSLSNGDWRFKFDLFKPGEDGTEHFIYGAITTPDGNKYNTVTGKTIYYHGTGILTDIEMIYGSSKIDFNYVEASTEPISYSYVPGNDMFTFMAVFRDGLGAKIKKLDFIILLSDGSRRRISGKYLTGTETWTCALAFPDVNRLPVNVKVIYAEDKETELIDDLEVIWRCPDAIPVIDPSGYLYEAVHSNRVPGVTSTIYYRELTEDNYGNVIEKAVKWNAEAYAQENPLFTDEEGMYQWDVPSGYWQVRFEKEGFEPTQTEWLPVPPPQLDVNVPITQMSSPEVKNITAYPEAVQIEFDKYMDPLTLTSRNIKVMVDEQEVTGTLELLDEEEADDKTYASKVLFKFEQPLDSDEVNVKISKVKSYAGVQMENPVEQDFNVETPIENISIPESTKAYVGYDKNLTVVVEPKEAAAGKVLLVSLNTPILTVDKSAKIDEEGHAVINLHGDLPGKAHLKFNVQDAYLSQEYSTEVDVDIVSAELPVTSVKSGTPVYRNEKVEIFTDSRIGSIYYTLDGSEPSETNGILYTGPVTLKDATVIKAINVINDAVYSVSDVAEFSFPLMKAAISHPLEKGWNWISHNLESVVKIENLSPVEKIDRIVAKTTESINDPVYGIVGNLKELSSEQGYKILAKDKVTLTGKEDIALHPSTPYTVYSGWNWIGYHGNREMEINQALSSTDAEKNDIIVGRDGFATYDGDKWIGDLTTLKPLAGYLYKSQSVKNVSHNPGVYAYMNAVKLNEAGASTSSDISTVKYIVDKSKYPSVMPVISQVVDGNGVSMESSDLLVSAFCSDECRGVGVMSEGYVFISVYGTTDDEITYKVDHNGNGPVFIKPSVKFSEEALGCLDNPFLIDMQRGSGTTSIGDMAEEQVEINVIDGKIVINGYGISSVIISDAKGINHYVHNGSLSEEIFIDSLAPGIYFISLTVNGVQSSHKVIIKQS